MGGTRPLAERNLRIDMKWFFIYLFISFSVTGNASTFAEFTATRLNDSKIQFYLTRPSTSSKVPLLIVLQGSACNSVFKSAQDFGPTADQVQVARLDLEKYGLNKSTKSCPQEYLENNTIDQRIADYLRVMQILQRDAAWWNKQVLIVGGSEGGVLAPILATYVPETTKLVVMAGGTGWTMYDEMLFLTEKQLRAGGANETEIQSELLKMKNTFAETETNPTGSKTIYGATNTYKWWNSILRLRPLNYMLDLNFPILMVHGDIDIATPVESARATVGEFSEQNKTNLTYIEFPGLDHHWVDKNGMSHGQEVLEKIFGWLFLRAN